MPANLPPLYFEAHKRFQRASTPWEKIEALEEMLAIMPHHKGTDHLRAELNGRMARFLEEAEKKSATGKKGPGYNVKKEGAGQVALVGMANVGKSQLVATLTNATLEIGDYPFTTKTAMPAMMKFENIQIQLVDLPAINDRNAQPWLHSVIRNADLMLILVDLSQDPASQLEMTIQELLKLRIGIAGLGKGETLGAIYPKNTIIAGNKCDLDPSGNAFELLRGNYSNLLPVLAISATKMAGLFALGKVIFQSLDIVRVYTKIPGQKAELIRPFVLKKGSTVAVVASAVHKDIMAKLKYAELWGSGKFQGQRVKRDYILQDGDVVELHT